LLNISKRIDFFAVANVVVGLFFTL